MPATIKRGWWKFPLYRWLFWRRDRAAATAVTETATVAFNTEGIADGVFWFRMPSRATVTEFICDVTTAFNAGTTNVLTVEARGSSTTEFAAAGDIDESSETEQTLTNPAVIAQDLDIYIKYAQTGDAADAGEAEFSLTYTPYY
ncbi:MAG TPA: hypothetical protein DCY18_05495 [Thauera sp.]|nr:hypothetical protein [Thauera sp.]